MKFKADNRITSDTYQASQEQGSEWDDDRVERALLGERRWKRGCYVLAIVSALVIGRLCTIPANAPSFPVIVKVDSLTGAQEIVETPSKREIMEVQELLDMHNVQNYVIHRESYHYELLQDDYDYTLAMSSDVVAREYSSMFEGTNPKDKELGQRYLEKVNVISVTLPPNQTGKAVVRFTVSKIDRESNAVASEDTVVSTIAFELTPKMIGKQSQLIKNPLGFKVTGYRRDVEMSKG